MAGGLEIGPDTILFQDDCITVRIQRFDAQSGRAEVLVDHKREPSGDYYIWVYFESGDSTRMDYNGANQNRLQSSALQHGRKFQPFLAILPCRGEFSMRAIQPRCTLIR